jgi:hypothetical protein
LFTYGGNFVTHFVSTLAGVAELDLTVEECRIEDVIAAMYAVEGRRRGNFGRRGTGRGACSSERLTVLYDDGCLYYDEV